uniref:Putative secreted protein n=1 Tax=Anopheles marajoara TaxID=58244 RepID=A0A2M4C669_9DIPT
MKTLSLALFLSATRLTVIIAVVAVRLASHGGQVGRVRRVHGVLLGPLNGTRILRRCADVGALYECRPLLYTLITAPASTASSSFSATISSWNLWWLPMAWQMRWMLGRCSECLDDGCLSGRQGTLVAVFMPINVLPYSLPEELDEPFGVPTAPPIPLVPCIIILVPPLSGVTIGF